MASRASSSSAAARGANASRGERHPRRGRRSAEDGAAEVAQAAPASPWSRRPAGRPDAPSKSWRSSRRQDSRRKAPVVAKLVEARPSPAPWRGHRPGRRNGSAAQWKTAAPPGLRPGEGRPDPPWAHPQGRLGVLGGKGGGGPDFAQGSGAPEKVDDALALAATGSHTPEFHGKAAVLGSNCFLAGGHQPLPRA